ncbi:hypothetical protein EON65_52050, partial [archaeon]
MHLHPHPQSLLFLILPRRCLASPFFSTPTPHFTESSSFVCILQDIFGFKLVEEHMTPKVAFFVLSLPATLVSSSTLDWTERMKELISENVL